MKKASPDPKGCDLSMKMKPDDFYELIKKREAEHVEEVKDARQRDMRRIQEMNSNTGLEPLELFPKEIWIPLLDQLLPQDKRNMREVHETFYDLTDEGLIGDILFPLILGCKVEQFWDDPSNNVFPLAHYFELRLVSKSLRDAVDRWFEDDLVTSLRSGKKEPAGVVEIISHEMLLDENNLHRLVKLMKMNVNLSDPSALKPQRFFTRSLAVVFHHNVNDRSRSNTFVFEYDDQGGLHQRHNVQTPSRLAITEKFLDRFGDQIWYFSFEFNRQTSQYRHRRRGSATFENRYTILMRWLSKMPNLKWLKLIINQTEEQTDIMFRAPEESSPPTLIDLERLDLELKLPNEQSRMPPVFQQFVSANPHVKILNMRGLMSVLGSGDIGSLSTCQALEALCIDAYDSMTSNSDNEATPNNNAIDHANLVQSIADTNWPLKRIELTLHRMEKTSVFCIFRSLETLQSLESICLSMEDASIGDDASFLKLPQLTHVDLKMKISDFVEESTNLKFFFSLQFLLYAKRLKTLIWKCDLEEGAWKKTEQDMEQCGGMQDFRGGFCDIKKSFVWRVFPWLKTVDAERIVRVDGEVNVEKSFALKLEMTLRRLRVDKK